MLDLHARPVRLFCLFFFRLFREQAPLVWVLMASAGLPCIIFKISHKMTPRGSGCSLADLQSGMIKCHCFRSRCWLSQIYSGWYGSSHLGFWAGSSIPQRSEKWRECHQRACKLAACDQKCLKFVTKNVPFLNVLSYVSIKPRNLAKGEGGRGLPFSPESPLRQRAAQSLLPGGVKLAAADPRGCHDDGEDVEGHKSLYLTGHEAASVPPDH